MYRRRRIVVLLALLLVVAGVVWGATALLGGGIGGGAQAGTPTYAPSSTAPDDATTPQPTTAPGEVAACDAAAMDADLAVDPPDPAPGTAVGFQVTLRNTGATPCLVDAGLASLVASVTSGGDAVWSSAHCAGEEARELLLDAEAEHTTSVRWAGRRSAEGCPGDQPAAGAGTYRVTLELAGERFEPPAASVFTIG